MSPVENKEHKPGPIGKERSLKNRKVKDAQQVEPEGQEKPVPAAVRSADPVTTKDPKAASEMSGDIGAMISVPAAEYGSDVKVSCARGCALGLSLDYMGDFYRADFISWCACVSS